MIIYSIDKVYIFSMYILELLFLTWKKALVENIEIYMEMYSGGKVITLYVDVALCT